MIRQRCTVDPRRAVAAAAGAILSSLCATALAAAAAVPAVAPPPVHAAPANSTDRSADGEWMHAYAAFGKPKYPRGFAHFDYVNPNAPRGGTLYLANPDRRTAFDKYNPFTVARRRARGLELFMLETLMTIERRRAADDVRPARRGD